MSYASKLEQVRQLCDELEREWPSTYELERLRRVINDLTDQHRKLRDEVQKYKDMHGVILSKYVFLKQELHTQVIEALMFGSISDLERRINAIFEDVVDEREA